MRILHLSDTHLTQMTGPDGDGVDTRQSLRRILHDCRELPGLDAVVVTGDVADDGSREAYTDALELVGGPRSSNSGPVCNCHSCAKPSTVA